LSFVDILERETFQVGPGVPTCSCGVTRVVRFCAARPKDSDPMCDLSLSFFFGIDFKILSSPLSAYVIRFPRDHPPPPLLFFCYPSKGDWSCKSLDGFHSGWGFSQTPVCLFPADRVVGTSKTRLDLGLSRFYSLRFLNPLRPKVVSSNFLASYLPVPSVRTRGSTFPNTSFLRCRGWDPLQRLYCIV